MWSGTGRWVCGFQGGPNSQRRSGADHAGAHCLFVRGWRRTLLRPRLRVCRVLPEALDPAAAGCASWKSRDLAVCAASHDPILQCSRKQRRLRTRSRLRSGMEECAHESLGVISLACTVYVPVICSIGVGLSLANFRFSQATLAARDLGLLNFHLPSSTGFLAYICIARSFLCHFTSAVCCSNCRCAPFLVPSPCRPHDRLIATSFTTSSARLPLPQFRHITPEEFAAHCYLAVVSSRHGFEKAYA